MKFLRYTLLNEDAKYYGHDDYSWIDDVLKAIKSNAKLYSLPIIWRGWFAKTPFYCALVSEADKRELLRGMFSIPEPLKPTGYRDWMSDLIKAMGFMPVCCSYSFNQASFFGNPCVVVPEANFKIFQNPDVNDMKTVNPRAGRKTDKGYLTTYDHTDQDINNIVKGYKEDYTKRNNEILVKCGSYYIVNVNRMLMVAKRSRFNKVQDVKGIATYQEFVDFTYNFRNYLKFLEKKRASLRGQYG